MIYLLGLVIHAFEAAHDIDPTVPRLVSIAPRRPLIGHKSSVRAPAEPPAVG